MVIAFVERKDSHIRNVKLSMLSFRKPAMSLGCVMTRGFRVFCVTRNVQRVASVCLSKYSNDRTNSDHLSRGLQSSVTLFKQAQETGEQITGLLLVICICNCNY